MIRDPEIKAAKEILDAAALTEGDEVLTEWEEEFVRNNIQSILSEGDKYDLSDKRKEVIDRIHKKLKKEGLV